MWLSTSREVYAKGRQARVVKTSRTIEDLPRDGRAVHEHGQGVVVRLPEESGEAS